METMALGTQIQSSLHEYSDIKSQLWDVYLAMANPIATSINTVAYGFANLQIRSSDSAAGI